MTQSDPRSNSIIPHLTSRLWKVWRRNFDVFMKTIHINFLPSLLEPLLYLAAFGFGLGALITGSIPGYASYIQFVAPGLISISIMYGSFYECTYASFVRMYFQKTFDAIIATPVSVEEVIAGEIVWGATRATINATIVLVVVAAFGLVSSPFVFLVPILSFFSGLLFASIGMCFTAMAKNIDFFNFPAFLFITPMFLLSGTFFPFSILPIPLQAVGIGVLPLTHVANLLRGMIVSNVEPFLGLSTETTVIVSVLWISLVSVVLFIVSIKLMKRKLIK